MRRQHTDYARKYQYAINQARTIAKRIRDEELGLRNKPLKDSDLQFKKNIEARSTWHLDWKSFDMTWYITASLDFEEACLNSKEKKELLDYRFFFPKRKATKPKYTYTS